MTTSPDLRFLFRHPAHLIAMGFGTGLAPKAPGTVGTLLAFPIFWLLPNNGMEPIFIALSFLFGIHVCGVTGRNLGVIDHGGIVWDEVVAMLLLLHLVPATPTHWALAFVLFRLFDIWKPFPIRTLDARLKNGFGVMLDDLLAAGYAWAALWAYAWLMTHF